MGLFNFKKRSKETDESVQMTDTLLEAFLQDDQVSRKMAMNVPTFAGCINTIGNTVASVPIYLYKRGEDGSSEKIDDPRVNLINYDTGDTFTGCDIKKAIVKDYYTTLNVSQSRNIVRNIRFAISASILCITCFCAGCRHVNCRNHCVIVFMVVVNRSIY